MEPATYLYTGHIGTRPGDDRKQENKMKIGQIVYWKTMFGEWFKGEITGMDSDNLYVTRLIPSGAFGVIVPRTEIV